MREGRVTHEAARPATAGAAKRSQRTTRSTLNLRHQASLEDIDWQAPRRGLDKALVGSLATCAWIQQHQNLVIIGPTGIGKSWLADAFAERACRVGYSAYRVRVPRLLHDLAVARGDGSYTRLLAKLAKTALLVLDDWGLAPLTGPQRHDILEVLEDRTERASTLLTSQLPPLAEFTGLLASASGNPRRPGNCFKALPTSLELLEVLDALANAIEGD
jgi:DNA replication protein DnaC